MARYPSQSFLPPQGASARMVGPDSIDEGVQFRGRCRARLQHGSAFDEHLAEEEATWCFQRDWRPQGKCGGGRAQKVFCAS